MVTSRIIIHVSLLLLFMPILTTEVSAQENESAENAIRATILNYIEGWYEGDVSRMDKALHPDLVKRVVYTDSRSGRSMYNQASKTLMMEYTRAGMGKKNAESKNHISISILDVEVDIASAKSVTPEFIDYIQLAKWNGEWKIVNVLWKQNAPKK